MRVYDLCVIGSGPAGQRAAIQAAKLGRSVCVVEKRILGGVAINTGTIPSKALREAIMAELQRSRGLFKPGGDLKTRRNDTFQGLLGACQQVIQHEVDLVRTHFGGNGVELFEGEASFVDQHNVLIKREHSNETIQAENILVSVGTQPARPPDLVFDGENVITSDQLVSLPYMPQSMIVVGGGVIGTEYASMISALGVRTTLVEGRDRLLGFVDREIVEALQYHLRVGGMTLRLGERVVNVSVIDPPPGARSYNGKMVQATLESGKMLRADCLLYCVGRQGATGKLGLENCNLEADHRGRLKVNDVFQTEVPHIYACGDVIGFPALASTSMEQGRLAACHMFGEPTQSVPELLPFGIYAVPEISMVGWTESKLTEKGIPYEAGIAQYREIARGQLLGDDIGMLKMLIHQETREILGVHCIGTGATELVHIGQAAIAFKATVDYFVNTVFNYPTLAECYKVAALNGMNKLRCI
ncbi:MAG: Si-specific NAD(P)(+) transhydrogenase [Bradymonadia bacterium]